MKKQFDTDFNLSEILPAVLIALERSLGEIESKDDPSFVEINLKYAHNDFKILNDSYEKYKILFVDDYGDLVTVKFIVYHREFCGGWDEGSQFEYTTIQRKSDIQRIIQELKTKEILDSKELDFPKKNVVETDEHYSVDIDINYSRAIKIKQF